MGELDGSGAFDAKIGRTALHPLPAALTFKSPLSPDLHEQLRAPLA